MKLTTRDEFNIRKYSIISIIRVLSEYDFSNEAIAMMGVTSQTVRSIYENNGTISDDAIFMLYDEKMKEENLKECRGVE